MTSRTSLRDDIVDELADHLACAYRRELLRGADAATARQRVLERFGDPAAVARRLWLDAMKGKIMTQRILVACCVLLTLISLSLAGMMWMQSRPLAAARGRCAKEPWQRPRCGVPGTPRRRCSSSCRRSRRRRSAPKSPGLDPGLVQADPGNGGRAAGRRVRGETGPGQSGSQQGRGDPPRVRREGHDRFRRRPARRLGVHAQPEDARTAASGTRPAS